MTSGGAASKLGSISEAYRVLLVEDNPAEAYLVTERLADSTPGTFEIIHVTSLGKAIEAARDSRFDCIVLDLQLPDSSGAATIREMRSAQDEAAIVAYSGSDDNRARAAALAEGAGDFISKNGAEAGSLDRAILFALERWRAVKLHKQLERLFDDNPDAVVVTEDGGRVKFANTSARATFGWSDQTIADAMLPFVVSEGMREDVAVSSEGGDRIFEIRVVSCTWDGAPALLSDIRDVTHQRQLAVFLRESQKLEAIGRFAGGLAHDLGNLLSCIDVFADLAIRQSPEGTTKPLLEDIKRAVSSGRGVIRQLHSLEHSREGEPELFSPAEALEELEHFLRRTLPADIHFIARYSEDAWMVRMDRGQFDQVVLNLALNARDAMPNGGDLNILCRNVADSDGEGVEVQVVDTGVGLSEDELAHVFELFYTTKPSGQGTGLGLSMCKAIVERAGGAISAQGREGDGATFKFRIPRAA